MQTPLSGTELAAAMKIGTRVVRGADWEYGAQDGPPPSEGTVIRELTVDGFIAVLWDAGSMLWYRMGYDGKYDLKLADSLPAQQQVSLSDSEIQNDGNKTKSEQQEKSDENKIKNEQQEKSDGNKAKSEQQETSRNLNPNDEKVEPEIHNHAKTRGLLSLSENLKSLFLEEEESDIIIKVGDQKYPAHKIIIKARSPVFYAMLKHDMKEKSQGFIDIPDCDPHIFKDFLLYLYTGKLDNISQENVFELYYMSDKYEVVELKTDCLDFIFSNINVERICDVIALATKHSERDLLKHATAFFIENAKDILLTVNWQKFVIEYPIEANELFIRTLTKFQEK